MKLTLREREKFIRGMHHDIYEGIAFLEAALLSSASSKARNIASMRGFLDVARYGKDDDKLRDISDSEG